MLFMLGRCRELNPENRVRIEVNRRAVGCALVDKPSRLAHGVVGELRYVQKTRAIVRSFAQHSGIRYAAHA